MWACSKGLSLVLTSMVFGFIVDMVILLVVKMTENTHNVVSASRMKGWSSWGLAYRNARTSREPRAGGVFSDDGSAYLCPKCLAFHEEYMTIMDKIESDRRTSPTRKALGTDHLYNRRSGLPGAVLAFVL